MEETTNSYWIEGIRLPDKDGNVKGNPFTKYEGRIKITLGKPVKQSSGRMGINFKTVLPDHIHSKLLGKEVSRSRGGLNSKVETKTYVNLTKTLSADSMEKLLNRFDEIVDDYLFLINDEKKPKVKYILIKWEHAFDSTSSRWNSAKMGKMAEISYNFFVCYHNGTTFFDIDHKAFSLSESNSLNEYRRIIWTLEREEFFERVYLNFTSMGDKLNDFFNAINENTIDSQITNFKLLS